MANLWIKCKSCDEESVFDLILDSIEDIVCECGGEFEFIICQGIKLQQEQVNGKE